MTDTDIYAALHLNDSCIGRNFFIGRTCGGFGDPCNECSGGEPNIPSWKLSSMLSALACAAVSHTSLTYPINPVVRDVDYVKRRSRKPHGLSFAKNNCNGRVHCLGGVYVSCLGPRGCICFVVSHMS